MKNNLKVDGFFLQSDGPLNIHWYDCYCRTLRSLLDMLTSYVRLDDAKRIKYEGKTVYRSYVNCAYGEPIGTVRFDRHGKAHLKRMPKTDGLD